MQRTEDLNVVALDVMPTPDEIKAKLPLTDRVAETVLAGRRAVEAILDGRDSRLFAVVGPCSIHDPVAGLDYARRLNQPVTDLEAKERSDALLRDHIERLQGEFPGYGYRRLGQQLRRERIVVNDKKIRRLQRKYQLFPIRWHSFKIATTDSNHGHKVYPNLLVEKTLTGINQAWVADITYIRIRQGFVFQIGRAS